MGVDLNADTDGRVIRFFTSFIINTEKGNNTQWVLEFFVFPNK